MTCRRCGIHLKCRAGKWSLSSQRAARNAIRFLTFSRSPSNGMVFRLDVLLRSREYIACRRRTRYVLRTRDSEVHPSRVHALRHVFSRPSLALRDAELLERFRPPCTRDGKKLVRRVLGLHPSSKSIFAAQIFRAYFAGSDAQSLKLGVSRHLSGNSVNRDLTRAIEVQFAVDMKKKLKSRLPFTTKPKAKYSFPVPIPPCSVVAVRKSVGKSWASKAGRVFRVGYYSKTDGLDCIWLVDETGSSDQTIDHNCLIRFFEIRSIAKERSLYGRGRPKFPPLVR
jgi:hypothetical protein